MANDMINSPIRKGKAGIFLLCLFFPLAVWAQSSKALNEATGQLSALVELGKYTYFNDDPMADGWRIDLSVDFTTLELVYRMTPAESDPAKGWLVTHRIPVLLIDTMYAQNGYSDSMVVIRTAPSAIRVYQPSHQQEQPDFLAAWNDDVTLPLMIRYRRKLIPRMLGAIAEVKKQVRSTMPETARSTVALAVFQYISAYRFNRDDVVKLLENSELFITKCQLCNGAKDAFERYIKTFQHSDQTAPQWRIGFMSSPLHKQKATLQKLVGEAVNAYLDDVNDFTPQQIRIMKGMLAGERKKSMAIAAGKQCPVCDGAVKP